MSKQNSFSFLRRLNWSFPPNFDQNNSESRTISCFLQHLKSVQELTQVYSYQSKFEDAENFKGIKNMKQLKKLKLDFWSQTDLSDEELQQLFRIVRGLNKLESFSLDLSRCLKLTPKSMKIIHHSILSLAKLTSLSLAVRKNLYVSESNAELFISLIKNLDHLESFSLNLYSSQTATEEVILSLLQSLQGFKRLKSLKIDLTNNPIRYQGIAAIAFTLIKTQQTLNTFALNTAYAKNIDDDCVSTLSLGLTRLENLKQLSLEFIGASVSNKGLKMLNDAILVLEHLDALKIVLGENPNLSNLGIKNLTQDLSKMSSLRNLNLLFDSLDIEDGALSSISQELQHLKCLKELRLSFFGILEFTDSGLADIIFSIKELTNLTTLALYFNCASFDEFGLHNWPSSVSKLTQLQELEICFLSAPNFLDECVRLLVEGFKGLMNLEKLVFVLGSCHHISNRSLAIIKEAFGNNPYMKEFILNVRRCPRISEEAIEKLAEELSFIESVKIIS